MIFLKFFYNIFLHFYKLGVFITALWSKKATLWLQGRKNWEKKLQTFSLKNEDIVWIHCSSLGEFEQAIPVIKSIKKEFLLYKIVVSFFSPSGFEVHKNNPIIDLVCYLPLDSKKNASLFLEIIKPKLILFIKYEFWFYYLHEARKRNIPVLLVSGIFRNNQPFFKWYGNFHKEMLKCFNHFFLQNENSSKLLQSIGFNNQEIIGDTRFERVIEIANSGNEIDGIKDFIGNNFCIVAGSTWKSDDKILSKFLNKNPDVKCIIAPHNIDAKSIEECLRIYNNSILLSESENLDSSKYQIIIINKIGLLSTLYKYANVCFVGGGFDKYNGVHNTIEAAVYSKPIIFGPYYLKYKEAVDLIELKGALTTNSQTEFEKILTDFFQNKDFIIKTGNIAGNYVKHSVGATQKVIDYIQINRLLTN